MVHGDVLGLGVWGLGFMVHGDVLGFGILYRRRLGLLGAALLS